MASALPLGGGEEANKRAIGVSHGFLTFALGSSFFWWCCFLFLCSFSSFACMARSGCYVLSVHISLYVTYVSVSLLALRQCFSDIFYDRCFYLSTPGAPGVIGTCLA